MNTFNKLIEDSMKAYYSDYMKRLTKEIAKYVDICNEEHHNPIVAKSYKSRYEILKWLYNKGLADMDYIDDVMTVLDDFYYLGLVGA